MSQCSEILRHLKKRPITPVDALYSYGCFRLAARINDLRSQGHTILTERVEDGDKSFAKYRLVKK